MDSFTAPSTVDVSLWRLRSSRFRTSIPFAVKALNWYGYRTLPEVTSCRMACLRDHRDEGRAARERRCVTTKSHPHSLLLGCAAQRHNCAQCWELMNLACLPSGAGFFSVDGRNLLFITPDGASRVLWSPVGLQPMWAEPAPDGRHLAINVGSGQTNVWMLTDF